MGIPEYIITGDDLPICGFCGEPYKPSENDSDVGICSCGRMVDLFAWDNEEETDE